MDGALIVDKPSGPTSHDVVARARHATGIRRIGHTGTLDPMATGVLVLLTGRATRLARFFGADQKEYKATVRLGAATDTYDATGTPVPVETAGAEQHRIPDRAGVEAVLAGFRGRIQQTAPPFSAKKIAGVRAYVLARRRAPVLPAPVTVIVHALELVAFDGTRLDLRVVSSGGFYVRSLAHDLGIRLGCGAYLEALRRARAGVFNLEQAVSLATLEAEGFQAVARVVRMAELLGSLPAVVLTEHGARRAAHGNAVQTGEVARQIDGMADGPTVTGPVRLFDESGALLAIAEPAEGATLHPTVVLV